MVKMVALMFCVFCYWVWGEGKVHHFLSAIITLNIKAHMD